MIELKNLVLRRGTECLLEGASATVFPGRRVGVIGANGCGKTSLFKLLMGELSPDAGEVELPRQWQIAQMEQEVCFDHRSAIEFVLDGDIYLRKVQAAIARAEAEGEDEVLAKWYAEFEAIDGYRANNRAEELLHGLGFIQAQISQAAMGFSGGWRIRLSLARALMSPADLLLLDEPTNHLDLDAVMWLEQWLKAYRGTLLLISHDRDFLDQVTDEILHIERQQLFDYRGNYSAFERQRAERLLQQQAAYEKQQQRIAEIRRFVTRFKAKATKARQAQSRVKELDRMESLAPAHIDSPFHFVFREAEKNSSPLIQLRDAVLGYGDKVVLADVNMALHPGARIGLLGSNGAGKSTLIKSLVGDIPLASGERVCGLHLRVGYFAQHQLEALDLDASPLLHIQRLSPRESEQSIRNFLGGFNFHGDKALAAVRPFSGGEKARLALAIVVWQRPNLLLLDEPTNHLDLDMRYALTLALQSYGGALLVISHDRHLLRNTVDEFYRVGEGKVIPFDGTLEDYQQWLNKSVRADSAAANNRKESSSKLDKKTQRQQAAAERLRLQPLTKKIRLLEDQIHFAQQRLAEIQSTLGDTTLYEARHREQLKILLHEQSELRKALQEQEHTWLELQEQLENLNSE